MIAKSLDELMDDLSGVSAKTARDHKMNHILPNWPVVDRETWILKHCKDKNVLDLGGASGALHDKIKAIAKSAVVIDKDVKTAEDYIYFDLDTCGKRQMPSVDGIDLIVAGEILEHLANPGYFLDQLTFLYLKSRLLVTVPNAFSAVGFASLAKGYEQVNRDHVAYYSYWTLTRLMERYGYRVVEAGWYNGKPATAEGIVMLVEANNGGA